MYLAIDVADVALSPFLIQIIPIFMLAGFVKGIVGFGLPTIGIGFGALISDIPTAMMLILVPTIFTNIAQVMATGSMAFVVKKTWAFLFGAVILIPLGLWVVVIVPAFPFDRLLGVLILVYSLVSLGGFNPVTHMKHNHVLGLTFGLLNSVLSGMTGSMTVPGVMYLRSLQLSSNDLLCAMGILFLISTIAIGGSLWWFDLATQELSTLSVMMCVPVALGVWVGMRVRSILSEEWFKQVFLYAFAFLGTYLMIFGG